MIFNSLSNSSRRKQINVAKEQGVTEQLKVNSQMEWIRQLNAIRAVVEEIVLKELIYT